MIVGMTVRVIMIVVVMRMIVPAVLGVNVTVVMSAIIRMHMTVVVPAVFGMNVAVIVVVATVFRVHMAVIMTMIVPAAAVFVAVIMSVIVIMIIMPVVMIAAVGGAAAIAGLRREQIEQRHHSHADTGNEHHVTEDAIRRQIRGDAAAGVKIEQHSAPDQHDQDAEEMNGGAGAGHRSAGRGVETKNEIRMTKREGIRIRKE